MKRIAAFFLFLLNINIFAQDFERAIKLEIEINASAEEAYKAWSTEEGIKSFFAPDCKITLEPKGAYEMYFVPEAPEGNRGGEGNIVLAFTENKMISFTWNAPPSFPNVREHRTSVVVRFIRLDDTRTKVTLHHSGWGEGEEWDKAFEYFSSAWGKVAFPKLKYRFEHGPIDWNNPPKL